MDTLPVNQPSPSSQSQPLKTSKISTYLLMIISLFVGVLVGYSFFIAYPLEKISPDISYTQPNSKELTLPADAVRIQSCANHKGSLYAKPSNIPDGPVYMVYNGKVIGIEFMLDKDDFLQGKSYQFLSALNVQVNHVNIGFLSQGHEGYPIPHYHVDLYTVGKEEELAIKCPTTSAQITLPPASSSALPTAQLSPASTSGVLVH